ncbi:hypothetical protein NOR_04463 [Metarhizium rileyi]|uniref:Uncharacterized protein n=1 Tax=Metarhizium rileyi (strain RCEF 4871) TaxID=1649241 RepID=A0A167DZG1_METRR|nr:hypothetical protein NOR_04463 [Metarhizium rileyi RCEF 4871]
MKDREYEKFSRASSLSREGEIRRVKNPMWMLIYWGWGVVFTAALFLVVTTLFGPMTSLHRHDELLYAEHVVSKAAHQLAIRGDCNETAALLEPAAKAMTAKALGLSGTISASRLVTDVSQTSTASADSTTEPVWESVPISTQTSLSTLYSVRTTSGGHTLTSTTTGTVTVTVSPVKYTQASESEDTCRGGVTETVVVTVYPTLEVSTSTDISYASGLPDVTLSGNPSTYTAIETDVTYTTGPPDATLSQDPATVTSVQTDVLVTTGLPDATVSGEPSTVTDVQVSWSWPITSTYATPVTTLTISDLWGSVQPPSDTSAVSERASLSTFTTVIFSQVTITLSYPTPSETSEVAGEVTLTSGPTTPSSTYTETVTETGGPPAIETTTVDVLPPAYTSYNTTSSTSSLATPIVVVSDGSKRPEPTAWGGSNGSSNVACTIMLIAVFMFLL